MSDRAPRQKQINDERKGKNVTTPYVLDIFESEIAVQSAV
jgi:hypothetical protein